MDGFIDLVITAFWLAVSREPKWFLDCLGPGHCTYCHRDYIDETYWIVVQIRGNELVTADLFYQSGSADQQITDLYTGSRAA